MSRAVRRLHFRTFSKNLPHPSAKFPFLDIRREEYAAWDHCVLHLYADRVGIVLSQSVWQGTEDNSGVMVWDWVNGEVLLVRYSSSVFFHVSPEPPCRHLIAIYTRTRCCIHLP